MNTRKIANFCLAIALMFPLFAGCQGQTTTSVPTSQPPPVGQEPTDTTIPPTEVTEPIKLVIYWVSGGPVYVEVMNNIFKRYQELNPNIIIDITYYNYGDYVTVMGPALEAKTKIDLAFSDPFPPTLPNYIEGGYVTDLTNVAEENNWREKISPGFLDFYTTYYKGMVVGYPLTPALRGFFYNKNIMDEIGGKVPETVDELEDLANKALAAGYIPLGLGNQTNWSSEYYWLNLAYGYMASEDWESWYQGTMSCKPGISWSSEPIRKALERFLVWEKAGYFIDGYNAIAEGDVHREFSKGNMLMYYYSAMSENSNLQDDKPDFEIGFFNFPAVTPGTPLLNMSDGGNVFFVPTTAAHPKEAIDLLNWLLTKEVAEMLASAGIVSAINIDVSNIVKPIPWMDAELAGLKAQTPLNWINWSVPGLGDVTGPEVQRLMAGETTLDEVLLKFQDAYDQGCSQ